MMTVIPFQLLCSTHSNGTGALLFVPGNPDFRLQVAPKITGTSKMTGGPAR